MRNYTRLVLGCALAASFAGRAAADPPINPVVAPVHGSWTPRVIATTRPATEMEPAAPGSTQPGRPQSSDTPPLVRPATSPEGVRPVGDTTSAPRPAPAGACLVVEKVRTDDNSAGKPLAYDIVVRNIGTVEAQRVRVEEQLPAGTTVLTTEPHAEAHDNALIWDLGHLAGGADTRLRVSVQPPSEGEFTSTATVTCATSCTMHAAAKRAVLVRLTVSNPAPIAVGQKAIFQIDLVNAGSLPLENIMLKARLPAGLSHPKGSEIEAVVPSLAAGKKDSVTLEVVALKPGRQVLTVTAVSASGGSTSAEGTIEVKPTASPAPVPSSVTGSPDVHPPSLPAVPEPTFPDVAPLPPIRPPQSQLEPAKPAPEGGPAVTFSVVDPEPVLEVGSETTYEIRVLNQGTTPTRDVLVQAVLPEEMTLLGVYGPTGALAQVDGRQVAFPPLTNLDGQKDAVYRVRVKAAKPGEGRFTALLQCGTMPRPLAQQVSTRIDSDETATGELTQK